ncbi:hypothetical protein [Kibdelosporangium aridum]|nr:hypothetical protein [Kibdelosporangium aridum]
MRAPDRDVRSQTRTIMRVTRRFMIEFMRGVRTPVNTVVIPH